MYLGLFIWSVDYTFGQWMIVYYVTLFMQNNSFQFLKIVNETWEKDNYAVFTEVK